MCEDSKELKIDARTGREPELISEGMYQGIISEFGDIIERKSRNGHFLQIKIKVEGETLISYVTGYLPAMMMIKQGESFYKGREVKVRVKHHNFMDRVYMQADIIWL